VVTMSIVTSTTIFVVVTINIVVVTIALSPHPFWLGEAMLTKRFVEATKRFYP